MNLKAFGSALSAGQESRQLASHGRGRWFEPSIAHHRIRSNRAGPRPRGFFVGGIALYAARPRNGRTDGG